MTPIYMILGALSFWSIVAIVTFVGSVAIAEWAKGRRLVKDVERLERLTPAQTDRLIREWRASV